MGIMRHSAKTAGSAFDVVKTVYCSIFRDFAEATYLN
jgi:hypothetical protein